MNRRETLLAAAALTVALPPRALGAQCPARIGWPASVPIRKWPRYPALTDGMRQRDWVEGRDDVMDDVAREGRAERLPTAVADLIARKPDPQVGSGTPPMKALTGSTSTIPQSPPLRAHEVIA
jgi:putative ABC transport system substrate-binding protein